MQVSVQLHIPTALPLGKYLLVSVEQENEWGGAQGRSRCCGDKSLASSGIGIFSTEVLYEN
jgi:hypothetical protein